MDHASRLHVRFLDGTHVVEPREGLTFGRAAALVIDDANPFMHRLVGEFVSISSVWTIKNRGSSTSVLVYSDAGTKAELVPGGALPLPWGRSRVQFEAGRARYELECINGDEVAIEGPQWVGGDTTTDWGVVPLNFEQRQLLVALAESRLRDASFAVPSNKALATSLGWTVKKVERKLDYLCERFAAAGVVGLQGPVGLNASDRRRTLVEHVVRQHLITSDDISILSVPGESES